MKRDLAAMREMIVKSSKPMTNFDQIKSFTLEEMAEFLAEHTTCLCCSRSGFEMCEGVSDCKTHIKEWLMSEV